MDDWLTGFAVGFIVLVGSAIGFGLVIEHNKNSIGRATEHWPAWTGPVAGFGIPIMMWVLAILAGRWAAAHVANDIVGGVGAVLAGAVAVAVVLVVVIAWAIMVGFLVMCGLSVVFGITRD